MYKEFYGEKLTQEQLKTMDRMIEHFKKRWEVASIEKEFIETTYHDDGIVTKSVVFQFTLAEEIREVITHVLTEDIINECEIV